MESAGRKQRKTRNYLVDKELQLRVLAYGSLYMLLVILATMIIAFMPLAQQMNWSDSTEIQYHAAQTFLLLIAKIVPAVGAIYVMYIIHLTLITHRICGPLVNFTNTFKRLEKGDLQRRVYLRHGDYLRKETLQINAMIDELAGIIGRLSVEHNNAVEQLDRIMDMRKESPSRNIAPDLENLRAALVSMGETLSFFRIGKTGEPEQRQNQPISSL